MKPKDEQKHQRILTAAITILAQGGLANFSTTKVAKLAGVPQSNIYIYFANKQDLLTAVYLTTVHQQSVAVTAALNQQLPLVTQLATSITALYRFATTFPAEARVIRLLTADQQFKTGLAAKTADAANQQIQTLLTAGVQRGLLRPDSLNLIRYFLTDPVYHYAELATSNEAGLVNLTQMILGAVLQPQAYQDWLNQ
ncbi:TetR/AcrR family transcriptional regulator [Levilactobacillus zymae]|uniref:Transcriptional regulator, TetR family n=1 Tax=Levilactobacillus zymae TaxID=267363 RepID=A0A1Y6K254_9LACO|nr:TetR/AcrR family transcriptional regulator [Levilactobacillus zymae]SMS15452.1 Transcriptional regulator, TetR family [Levilactobacillus zymae]